MIMDSIFSASWIRCGADCCAGGPPESLVWSASGSGHNVTDAGFVFSKCFDCAKTVRKASLQVTALGVYQAQLNGARVGDFILAPGWTSYSKRLQYQTYDITAMLREHNQLDITVCRGWRFLGRTKERITDGFSDRAAALIAAVDIEYHDGSAQKHVTDGSWQVEESKTRYANIYNGEICDASFESQSSAPALAFEHDKSILLPQQGEKIAETQRLEARALINTPKGETVIDFGQNLTGYVEFTVRGGKGRRAVLHHAEILDKDGNFYTENLRTAKQEVVFICDGEAHRYKPSFSFQGFRYIRLTEWPGEPNPADFTAVVVHSDMKRTGYFECSDPLVNRLFENIVWGQRGNFLDIPTDCPQRDERLGWTGDAQVFFRTASYNYDVEKFFCKWLADLAADQAEDGSVPHVVPNIFDREGGSAAWGDAAVIIPWQMYLTYGNQGVLERQFDSMTKWIDFIQSRSRNFIWNKGDHFGDWLNLEKENGGKPADKRMIATAYAAYSTGLLVKAGKVLGRDMARYEQLHRNIVWAFRRKYIKKNGQVRGDTQTGCALALKFGLADNKEAVASQLEKLVKKCGHLTTGFVGTPCLLGALTENGRVKTAYDLLMRREYPSWLYPVTMGATTIWERWNGMLPDGTLADKGMNSFNHYAYGAVGEWLYGTVAGINPDENAPGFRHIVFQPVPDERLSFARASLETRHGLVEAGWKRENGKIIYTFTVPQGCSASVRLGGESRETGPGTFTFEQEG